MKLSFVFHWVFVSIVGLIFVATNPLYAGRPLTTDDAGTVEKGSWEIEIGENSIFDKEEDSTSFELGIKYGILKNWDFGICFPYIFLDQEDGFTTDGLGDICIGTKYNFFEENEYLPSFTISLECKTTTGSRERGLGTGEKEWSINNILSKSFGKWTIHMNLGYTFAGEEGDDTFCYGYAFEYCLNEKVNLVSEIFGDTTFEGDFDDNCCSCFFGCNYAFSETIVFDFGAGFGISESAPDFEIRTGLTLTF